MKKFLSVLLMLAMLVSFAPAAFAGEPAELTVNIAVYPDPTYVSSAKVEPAMTVKAFAGQYVDGKISLPNTSGDYNVWIGTTPVDNVDAALSAYTAGADTIDFIVKPLAYVSLDVQGHAAPMEDCVTVYSHTATSPESPTPIGKYTFGGWYKDAACTDGPFDFNTQITHDITLYAKWTAEDCTVNFDVNGGDSASTPASQTVKAGTKLTRLTDPTWTDHKFDGWYKELECQNEFDPAQQTVENDMTLYAKWQEAYDVTYNSNGGSTVPSKKLAALPDPLPTPTKEGYEFAGWFYDNDTFQNQAVAGQKLLAPVTLFAKWNVHFEITDGADSVWYKGSGAGLTFRSTAPYALFKSVKVDGAELGEVNYTKRSGSTLVTLKPDYLGTLTAGIHNLAIESEGGTPTTRFTVKDNCTVSFDVQGHGVTPDSQPLAYGEKATRPADPTSPGWIFEDWFTTAEYTTKFDFDKEITADTVIYAKWRSQQHKVTFDLQGHGTAISPVKVDDGKPVTRPTDPTADGYRFKGWYTAADYRTEFNFNTPINADTTLYAKWDKTSKVTATVNTKYAKFNTANEATLCAGESFTFTTETTNSNYYVGRVLVDGIVVSGMQRTGTKVSYTFTNNNTSKDHIVHFEVYNSKDVPPTGDSFNPLLWGTLLTLSAAGAAAAIILYKKKNNAS